MIKYSIKSSNIMQIGYDEITEILEIEFKLNVIYNYHQFPLDEFVSLMKAEEIEEYYFNFIMSEYHYDIL